MRTLFVAATLAAFLTLPVHAEDWQGFYAGVYGGGAVRNSSDIGSDGTFVAFDPAYGAHEQPTGVVNVGVPERAFELLNEVLFDFPYPDFAPISMAGQQDGTMNYDAAPLLGVVGGYSFGNGLRVEADLSLAKFQTRDGEFDASTMHFVSGISDPGTGIWTWESIATLPIVGGPFTADDLRATSSVAFLLANAWYDVGEVGPVSPYFGGGLGLAAVRTHWQLGATLLGADGDMGSSTVLAPAAQLGAGLRFALNDTASIDLGYRYKLALAPTRRAVLLVPGTILGDTGYAASEFGPISVHVLQAGLTFDLR